MDELLDLLGRYRDAMSLAEREQLADQIIDQIGADLSRYIRSRFRQKDAVDDVLQETLIAIALGLPKFQGTSRPMFWSWCYRIALRACFKTVKKPKKAHFCLYFFDRPPVRWRCATRLT